MTPATPDRIVTKPSPYSVGETVRRLTKTIEDKGLTLFAVIDHSGEAQRIGLQMPDTKLVIFGSPAAGTPVMLASPFAALDLPLKVLVSEEADGKTSVSYASPTALAAKYDLTDELRSGLEGIGPITDAAVRQ
jgi:uncharacterized protein (DUF302 family)